MPSRADILSRGPGLIHTVRPSYAEVALFIVIRFCIVFVNIVCILIDMWIWHHHKLCEADRVCSAANPPDACGDFSDSVRPAIVLLALGALADLYTMIAIPHTVMTEVRSVPKWQSRADIRSACILRVEITIEAVNVAMSAITIIGVFYRYVVLQVQSHDSDVYPDTQHHTGVILMVTMASSALAATALHTVLLVNYISILSKQQTDDNVQSAHTGSMYERKGLIEKPVAGVEVQLDRVDGLTRRRPRTPGTEKDEEDRETETLL